MIRHLALGPLFLFASFLSAASPQSGDGQLGAPLEWMQLPDGGGVVHLLQRTRDGRLLLTPNEAFFPKLGLKNTGTGTVPDTVELNGGNSFASIEAWDEGDQVEWGLWFEQAGVVTVAAELAGGDFSVTLAEQTAKAGSTASEIRIPAPGRYSLLLTCNSARAGASVQHLEIAGPAAQNAGVLRKRWRPAAAHTKFESSSASGKIRLWVMEMDAVPGDLDFYCPITTPFGYYGPTWKADGTVNSSFNFSLWSFRRGAPEPPVEQLSHLLAIGHPEASFGGFDHEGTGVKIRDWEPLEGRRGQRQALALRVEPGPVYDTYYSYFYAADEGRWRLFGAGNKWNKGKPVDSLWVGSFVEVPGPPPVQRTGPYERRMRYRGWVMDDRGKWSALDRMQTGNANKETGLTHTHRGVTEEGWFFLETGGWNFRPAAADAWVELKGAPPKPVDADYLEPEALAALTTLPSGISATKLERAQDKARVTFHVRNLGDNARATLHWGEVEGLTLAERWAHQEEVPELKEGENQFVWGGVPAGRPLRVRLLLRNNEGQFWTKATLSAE
jgi:hypothetical protein